MSSTVLSTRAQHIQDTRILNYVLVAGLAVLVWDSILTFSDEVCLIWRKKLRFVPVFYAMARYASILVAILHFAEGAVNGSVKILNKFSWENISLCNRLDATYVSLNIIAAIGTHGFLVLRAYAISRGNVWVLRSLIVLFGIYLASFIANLFFDKCNASHYALSTISTHCTASTVGTVTINAVILTVMVTYAYLEYRYLNKQNPKRGVTFYRHLVREGLTRFGIVTGWTVEILFNQQILNAFAPSVTGVDAPVQQAIAAIFMCRFMLGLRRGTAHLDEITLVQEEMPMCSVCCACGWLNEAVLAEFAFPSPYEEQDSEKDRMPGQNPEARMSGSTLGGITANTSVEDLELGLSTSKKIVSPHRSARTSASGESLAEFSRSKKIESPPHSVRSSASGDTLEEFSRSKKIEWPPRSVRRSDSGETLSDFSLDLDSISPPPGLEVLNLDAQSRRHTLRPSSSGITVGEFPWVANIYSAPPQESDDSLKEQTVTEDDV
ncbi:hypothetical protein M422DRAFT_251816 [Sphaerobolus stellatus SS14]|uniref:DUF6533 domain-containing protein n=1 Tax=Sphaerobolus stellatus (strain SS14) TaxID=990650 RepID=A0A0C9VR22_SPHS4|nr:hypothetical protein M422DRAFT_251816 [Sphaerobolus stellatus SS14]